MRRICGKRFKNKLNLILLLFLWVHLCFWQDNQTKQDMSCDRHKKLFCRKFALGRFWQLRAAYRACSLCCSESWLATCEGSILETLYGLDLTESFLVGVFNNWRFFLQFCCCFLNLTGHPKNLGCSQSSRSPGTFALCQLFGSCLWYKVAIWGESKSAPLLSVPIKAHCISRHVKVPYSTLALSSVQSASV